MPTDRDAMPTRINQHVEAVAPPIGELGACVANPDPVERALQVARWIYANRSSHGPKHADSWQEPATREAYAKHRNQVTFVELTNAGTLAMLCETIDALNAGSRLAPPERAAKCEVACTHLLAIVGGPWRITDADIASRGDGVTKPYESWRMWARRMTQLPQCHPPEGYKPPPPKAPDPEPGQTYGRPVNLKRLK